MHRLDRLALLALGAALAAIAPAPAHAQRPLNLDFEMPAVAYPDRPWGWSLGWSAFAGRQVATFALDSTTTARGRWSLRVTVPDSTPVDEPESLVLQVPAAFARGKVLTLRGAIRTADLVGRAEFTLEAWGDRRVAAGDTARFTATAMPTFAHRDLRITVPTDADIHSIVIQVGVAGHGTAWFDDLTLTLDGKPIDAIPGDAAPPTPTELQWLANHAVPLRTVAVDDDRGGDLDQVDRIIGDARLVGLGESTHGTHEFFAVKARIIRHLVRDRGFRVMAMEANQLALEKVNRYLEGSSDSVRAVMRTMFRVWNTETMQGLLEWLRAFNAAHPGDRVRFVGYDMQDQRTPYDTLKAIVGRLEPALLPRVEALAGEYRAQRSYATPQVADSIRARWGAQADSLWRLVSGRRAAWLAGADERRRLDAEWAVQSANLIRQAAGFNVQLFSPERDSLMAANLDWALTTLVPGKRAIVWAHDVHVSKGGDPALSFNGGAQMGAQLRRTHGDAYRVFSLLTADGAYSATRGFSDYAYVAAAAFPAPPGSVEAALAALRRPAATVGWVADLRAARSDPAAAWLRVPRPIRSIGYSAYDYGFDLTAVLPLEFDGVVFIEHTTPSRLLP